MALLPYNLRFEYYLDKAKRTGGVEGAERPDRLSHYTSWDTAQAILSSQRFRATSHRCTNDRDELKAADAALLEVAGRFAAARTGFSRKVAERFVASYPRRSIATTERVFLVCFSKLGDDLHQWTRYGRDRDGTPGAGVCLEFAMWTTPAPAIPQMATGFLPIEYDDATVRSKFKTHLLQQLAIADARGESISNRRTMQELLNVQAMAFALSTKGAQWHPEQEVRMVFLVRESHRIKAIHDQRPSGEPWDYIEVPITANALMPLVRVVIGPNCSTSPTEVDSFVRGLGYTSVQIVRSICAASGSAAHA